MIMAKEIKDADVQAIDAEQDSVEEKKKEEEGPKPKTLVRVGRGTISDPERWEEV
jgi:hypothetical protein